MGVPLVMSFVIAFYPPYGAVRLRALSKLPFRECPVSVRRGFPLENTLREYIRFHEKAQCTFLLKLSPFHVLFCNLFLREHLKSIPAVSMQAQFLRFRHFRFCSGKAGRHKKPPLWFYPQTAAYMGFILK